MNTFETSPFSFHPYKQLPVPNAGGMQSSESRPPPSFYPAGTEIYAQGELCNGLFIVEFGAVRIYRLLSDGRRQISAFHLAGGTFGFEADRTHHFFAEAISATGIRILRSRYSRDDLDVDFLPMVLQNLLHAQEHLLVLGRQNSMERVAAFLLEMSERQGRLQQIELPMPRLDIADYLGLTIETVSRVFSTLKRNGVIRLPSLRSVEIVRWQTLQNMAS